MRKILSLVIVITMLFASLPVHALEMSDLANAQDEAALREAVRGDELWENSYPNGLFNFVGTQHVVNESNDFLEIAIARQGGTAGDVSVDFKAIDVSAEYGIDYVIRVYENSAKLEMKKDENAVPLIETLGDNPELNISEPGEGSEEESADEAAREPGNEADTRDISEDSEEEADTRDISEDSEKEADTCDISEDSEEEADTSESGAETIKPELDTAEPEPEASEPGEDTIEPEQEYIDLEPKMVEIGDKNISNSNTPKSLRELREAVFDEKSDRPDWRTVDHNTIEQLKAEYDEFFYNVPGAETTIEFKDGEYIKYLYIVPLNDDISESEEQILLALTNPTSGAVRGEFYMSYVNIKDDEPFEASNFEIVEDSVVAENGKASVVVRRTGGIEQYASVYVGTEESTAISGVDYVPGIQELFFTPGMTEQTVTVNLRDNPNRTNTREFVIALDRENKNINLEKAAATIIIPAEPDTAVLLKADSQIDFRTNSQADLKAGAQSLSLPNEMIAAPMTAAEADTASQQTLEGVEKISTFGYSEDIGQWTLPAEDFLAGWSNHASSPKSGYFPGSLLLAAEESPNKEAYARTFWIKLFGVESLDCSYHLKGTTDYNQINNYLAFEVVSPDSPNIRQVFTDSGNKDKTTHAKISEDIWNSSEVGLRVWSAKNEYTRAWIKSTKLNLKEYTIEVKNDVENVPEFQVNKYKIEKGELESTKVIEKAQPGKMTIKSVYSNVNNNQNSEYSTTAGVYRSDLIEFNIEYYDNVAGRISTYEGFEIYIGNEKWKRFEGTTLSLDENFFYQAELRDAVSRTDVIQVRPVFSQKRGRAIINIQADIKHGYIVGLGQNVGGTIFPFIKTIQKEISIPIGGGRKIVLQEDKYEECSLVNIGDVISVSAINNSPSITPSWSSNNDSAIVPMDIDGSNLNVDYQITQRDNYLKVNFVKPTLVVQANPNVYLHNVSKPTYQVDGVTYTDMEELHLKMNEIYEINSDVDDNKDLYTDNDVNPEIALSFKYAFNEKFPDSPAINEQRREAFGTPQEAILTVYKSDGTVRGTYPSIKDRNALGNYTVTANNGKYTYSGYLKELGWEYGDYATVIIYGDKYIGTQLASTRETVIDFLTNSSNAVIVERPDGTITAGNIYNPVTINKADPIRSYKMTSIVSPKFVTVWKDCSGDINGDGEVTTDEYSKLESRMNALGSSLDNIFKNPTYKEFIWGNFFNYIPIFNPSKVLYDFEKVTTGTSTWTAGIIVNEVYRTVLNPNVKSNEMPIKDTVVIVGNESETTDAYGSATIIDDSFQKGRNYLARIIHKGYEFYTYVQPGTTIKHVFDTTDIMRPENFKGSYNEKSSDCESEFEKIPLGENNRLVPVRDGITRFKFSVDHGGQGVKANNAIIKIYSVIEHETGDNKIIRYRDKVIYEKWVGSPDKNGEFTHQLNLENENIKPGCIMTISPLYVECDEIVVENEYPKDTKYVEYPEVEVGLTFSLDLKAITTLGSFKTHIEPAVEFLGKVTNSFDLAMNIPLDDISTQGTRVDEDGVSHNTKIITFGYNKDFEKIYGKEKDDKKDEKITITLEDIIAQGGSGEEKKNTQDTVNKNKGKGAKKINSSGTLKYGFDVSLALTIEEGEYTTNSITTADGFHYFSSMVLMVSGKANYNKKYTYVTPIGIPVYASISIYGNASMVLAIEADDSNRYVKKYRFDGDGKIPLNKDNYSIYTQFFINPGITIEAGAGSDNIKAFIEGNANINMTFTAPITADNVKSSGSGKLVISAKAGIKVLFIQKKWTIYKSKPFELFSYGRAQQAVVDALNDPYTNYLYQSVEPPEEGDIIPRDYLLNTSGWLGDNVDEDPLELPGDDSMLGGVKNMEKELLHGAYPYPQTKIVPFKNESGDKLLVLFVGDPGESQDKDGNSMRDSLNRAQLFYTIYDGSTWSVPAAVDDDYKWDEATWDEAPDAFVVDNKILVTWADAGKTFGEYDTAATILSAMNISGRWFDIKSAAFEGDKIEITKDTTIIDTTTLEKEPFDIFGDTNPMIAYDSKTERLMVYYTKIDYNLNNDEKSEPWKYDNTPKNDTDAYKEQTDDGDSSTVYGDIVHGYNVLAYRYAQKQADGSFEWNTTYEDDESYKNIKGAEEGFYGQRFLDLAVSIDIEETENEISPDTDTFTVGTVQVPTAIAIEPGKRKDPLVTNYSLIEYDGLALYSYVLDEDSSKSTTNDQELFMQIYNFSSNEFHHPIRITNNDIQDTKPQFVRINDITYLYWLSGGDIVYMDITNLVKKGLLKKVIVDVGGKSRSIYIIDKSKATKNGFINIAVDSREDYPIEDFQIQSNGESEYLLWTDYVISYKDGLKPGDPGTDDPKNINKEKQIFAAYQDLQYEWSKPVQLTHEAGANYSDISFKVNDDNDIQAAYIKYGQILEDDTNTFTKDTSNCIFAASTFDIESTVDAGDIEVSQELPESGRTLNFTAEINNTGVKPLTGMKYVTYMKQNGEEVLVKDAYDIFNDDGRKLILGGDSVKLYGAFDMPKDLTNIAVGFRILDREGNLLLKIEKALRAEPILNITVLNGILMDKNTANLALCISNDGNVKYDKAIGVFSESRNDSLSGMNVILDPGESEMFDIDFEIDDSMFTAAETAEDGSVFDKLELTITDGEYSVNTDIKRIAEKSTVDNVNNIKSFSVNRSYITLLEGSTYKLNANTALHEPIPEDTVDPMQVKWRTSNADVASVLPDGTVIGLSNGSATITATLLPRDDTTATLNDGSITTVDTSYRLPANMIQKKSVAVTILGNDETDDDTDDTNNKNIIVEKEETKQPGDQEQPGEIKHSNDEVIIELEPKTEGKTSTIIPGENAIADALQKLKEENKSTLTFTYSSKDDNEDDDPEVVKLIITSDILDAIADSEASKIVFETSFGRMVLKKETIDSLKKHALQNGEKQDITIQISQISEADIENYPDDLKKLIGNRPVYDFSIMVGDKNLRDITDDPIGLTLELGNIPEQDLSINPNQIVGAYISEDGKYKLIPLSALIDGKMVIRTAHNSLYSAAYNKVQFDDVSGWSEDFIAFLSARSIINGKGNNKFAPKDNITRAEFVKIMAIVADADMDKFIKSSFKDVDVNKWYAPYIEWAYTASLVNGIGNDRFAPDENITREDMAVLISRFAEKLGFELPELNGEKVFKDNSEIAVYAKESVKSIQKASIIEGKPNGTFAPKDNATREEAAKVFTVLIKLIVE